MSAAEALPDGFPVGARFTVVGGAGAVGRLFAERLCGSGAEVTVVDLAPVAPPGTCPGIRYLQGDLGAVDERLAHELARADAVVLAVPELIAYESAGKLCELLGPRTLLVDTLSVKGPLVEAVRAAAPTRELVGLNPMFAPALGFEGRPVAAVGLNSGARSRQLLALVGRWGGRVVPVAAEAHDSLAAATQALPHAAVLALGLALPALGIDIVELASVAPPPFTTMLALLARISSGNPEVYWDIQWANPQAGQARTALADGLRTLSELVRNDDGAGFAEAQQRLRGYLGSELDRYTAHCAQLFTVRESTSTAHVPTGGNTDD
ncbi:prephenate dehydrogenase/arogenate dehydrogenase family protein [Streptacidiphilus sp. N1-3]|uniref:Prephenate dehydrogenase/arogenate dehydrogenase family protein n=1 Tax=Streptacidiphilus alkalitolerans TaxID=3342712 RepID=A0ABV6WTM8_9ACTN